MNKKKILIFSLSYFPRFVGGAEVAIKEITDRLSGDFEFHLITLRYDSDLPRESDEGSVRVHRVGWGSRGMTVAESFRLRVYVSKVLYIPLATLKAIVLHQKEHFDGMWAMMSYMVFPIVLLRFFGIRVPYTLTLQEGDPFEYVFKRWYIRVFSPLLSYGFKHAQVIQVISSFLGVWARSMGASRVEVVPNGVDTARYGQAIAPARRAELRSRMQAKESETLLITTSRLVHKNGVDTVLEALVHLPKDVRFAIVGDGPDRPQLMLLAERMNVADRVVFVGAVSGADIPDYLASADIFIRVSRSEGMGNSFIEAIAAGLPTIGTAVGGITDFLHNRDTGYVAAVDNPQDVAETVLRVVRNPEEAHAITVRGQVLVRNQYDWTRVAERMREIFNSALSVVR